MSHDDEYHNRYYDGMGVYIKGPYWSNKDGTGKKHTKATNTNELFGAYYEGDSAEKPWRIRNSKGKTVGFTTKDNLKNDVPPP